MSARQHKLNSERLHAPSVNASTDRILIERASHADHCNNGAPTSCTRGHILGRWTGVHYVWFHTVLAKERLLFHIFPCRNGHVEQVLAVELAPVQLKVSVRPVDKRDGCTFFFARWRWSAHVHAQIRNTSDEKKEEKSKRIRGCLPASLCSLCIGAVRCWMVLDGTNLSAATAANPGTKCSLQSNSQSSAPPSKTEISIWCGLRSIEMHGWLTIPDR